MLTTGLPIRASIASMAPSEQRRAGDKERLGRGRINSKGGIDDRFAAYPRHVTIILPDKAVKPDDAQPVLGEIGRHWSAGLDKIRGQDRDAVDAKHMKCGTRCHGRRDNGHVGP